MSQLEVDKIIPSSGTTLTIGDSGDTINISDGTALTVDSTTFVIDQSANRVGINTATPSFALSVSSTSSNTITAINTASNVSRFCFAENSTPSNTYTNIEGDARSSGYLAFRTNDSERMRIKSDGKIGINTTVPQSKLDVNDATTNSHTTNIKIVNNAGWSNSQGYLKSLAWGDPNTVASIGAEFDGGKVNMHFHSFYNGAYKTETTKLLTILGNGRITRDQASTNGHLNLLGEVGTSYKAIVFRRVGGGAEVGSIVTNTSSTSYNTSSDYRLKENVVEMTGATERLKQLQPKRFNFINDADNTVDGFLAHEVSSIVPEAVSGEKDAMRTEEYEVTPAELDQEGNIITEAVMGTREVPDYQGIDQSKLVPLLVATIKELEARIEALENA